MAFDPPVLCRSTHFGSILHEAYDRLDEVDVLMVFAERFVPALYLLCMVPVCHTLDGVFRIGTNEDVHGGRSYGKCVEDGTESGALVGLLSWT